MVINEVILSMDIGGTNIRHAFVDRNYKVFNFEIAKSKKIFGNNPVQNLIIYIDELIKKFESSYEHKIIALSIGFPSTVDKDYRKIISTPNLPGLNNIHMADILEEKFNIATFVNKDVCMLLLYDIYINDLAKDCIIIGCYIGTGFGNAIYIDGRLIVGKNGVAGELGHIPVLGGQNICGCGNTGCIEIYASGKCLTELWKANFNNIPISEIFSEYSETPQIKEFIEYISIPVATEINILDPSHIILGGGVLQMKNFPRLKFENTIKKYSRKPFPEQNLNFIYTVEKNTNGVIGAGIFGFSQLNNAN